VLIVEPTMRRSPIALVVLSLLRSAPLHPYGMQRLIRQWGKDQVVNVGQRANLYKTIRRLNEAGLIAVRQTERDQQYPERTVYELTDEGRREGAQWLAEMLATPRNEFPEFPAALSFVMLLAPEQALAVLGQRATAVRADLDRIEAGLATYGATLPRVTMIEDEYQRAMLAAELGWLDGVLDDLRTGALTWSEESLAELAGSDLAGSDLAASELAESSAPPD
jgi:DNA-binding PadR family transcriptional regulator